MRRIAVSLTIYFIRIYLECWLIGNFLLDTIFELMLLRKLLHKSVSLRLIHAAYQSCNCSIGFLFVDNTSLFRLTHIPRLVERRRSNKVLLDWRLRFPLLSMGLQKDAILLDILVFGAEALELFIFLDTFVLELHRICISFGVLRFPDRVYISRKTTRFTDE